MARPPGRRRRRRRASRRRASRRLCQPSRLGTSDSEEFTVSSLKVAKYFMETLESALGSHPTASVFTRTIRGVYLRRSDGGSCRVSAAVAAFRTSTGPFGFFGKRETIPICLKLGFERRSSDPPSVPVGSAAAPERRSGTSKEPVKDPGGLHQRQLGAPRRHHPSRRTPWLHLLLSEPQKSSSGQEIRNRDIRRGKVWKLMLLSALSVGGRPSFGATEDAAAANTS